MAIKKLRNSSQNPKTGKTYSTFFKRRTIEYLLSGMYDEQTIWEKFQINSTLLLEWRKWFYKHFEAKNYSTPNYGKKLPTIIDGQIATEADKRAQRATEGLSERAKQRKAEEALFRAYSKKLRGKTSNKTKKNGGSKFKN